MNRLQSYSQLEINSIINKRIGETKFGEKIKLFNYLSDLENPEIKFVLIGIPEDIGVRANGGIAGTKTAWSATLQALLNVQYNEFNHAEKLLLLGHLDFTDLEKLTENKDHVFLSKLVCEIDAAVCFWIQKIISFNKIPIVIGGGHNNAYGILNGVSSILNKSINCINIDAHADIRSTENRHSGNGFSFALEKEYLNKYGIIGLQKNYNNQYIIDLINNSTNIKGIWLDDLIHENDLLQSISGVINFCKTDSCGLEIDLDSIANTLSSAMSPIGFSVEEVRRIMFEITTQIKPVYLHIAEGATELANGKTDYTTGKLTASLITDFIRNYPKS